MARRRDAILAHRHAARLRYLLRYLNCRQDAAMPRFGPLTQFEFDHLDLFVRGHACKGLMAKASIGLTTPEIARSDFPNDVAAHFPMIRAEAALSGVVGEATTLRTTIECTD